MLGAPEQLSVAEAVLNGKLTAPLEPKFSVIETGAVIIGAVLSTTVTVLVAVLTLPEASVAVIVMVLLPISLQSKLVVLNVTVAEAVQLSVTLATISLGETEPAPFASSATVTAPDTVVIVGALLSTTVNVTCDVAELPEASIADIVTVFVPKSAQPKLLGVIVTVGVPQLSVTLETTSFVPTVAAPLASKAIVTVPLSVVIVGAVLS